MFVAIFLWARFSQVKFVQFWLKGCIDNRNCRICNDDNPTVTVETLLKSRKVIVCCVLRRGGITVPNFLKNLAFRAMINDLYLLESEDVDVNYELVPARRRYMTYSERINQFIEENLWCSSWPCGMGIKIERLNIAGILFESSCEVACLNS